MDDADCNDEDDEESSGSDTYPGPDIYPSEDELPDDPPDISDAPIAKRIEEMDDDASVMEIAWTDWFASTTPEERQRSIDRHGRTDPDNIPDSVDIPDDYDLTNTTDESE